MADLKLTIHADYSEVERLDSKIKALETKIKNYNPVITPKADLSKWQAELTTAKSQFNALCTQLGITDKVMQKFGQTSSASVGKLSTAARQAVEEIRKTGNAVRDTDNAFESAARNIGSIVQQYGLATLTYKGINAAISQLKQSVSTIMDFQSANSTLQAILGVTDDEMDGFRATAEELGRTTMFTASQVTSLQTALAKLGFDEGQIHAMEKDVLNFAQATGAQLDEAAETTGAALRMFNVQADQYEEMSRKYTNAMATATMRSALDFRMIRDNLATFGPMASSMGLQIEDVLALFGKLKDNGVEASTAMTSLRNIFTKVAQGKIEGMGEVKSLDDFVEGLKRMGDLDTGKGMKMIGPRGGTQFITLINQADSIKKLRDDIRSGMEQDTTGDMAGKMVNNLSGQLKMLQSAWEGFILTFRESDGIVKDVVASVTDMIGDARDFIAGESDWSREQIEGLASVLQYLIGTVAVVKSISFAQDMGESVKDKFGDLKDAYNANLLRQQGEELAKNAGYKNIDAQAEGKRTAAMRASIATLQQEIMAEREATLASIQATARTNDAAVKKMRQAQINVALVDQQILANKKLLAEEIENARVAQLNGNAQAKKIALAEAEKRAKIELTLAKQREIAVDKLREAEDAVLIKNGQQKLVQNGMLAGSMGKTAGAVGKLSAAMDALGLSMLTNPYVLAAAAVIGLGYAIYHIITVTNDATRAQESLNNAMTDYKDKLSQNTSQAAQFKRDMEDGTKTVNQRVEAYKNLLKMSRSLGSYSMSEIINMSDEEFNSIINADAEQAVEDHYNRLLEILDKFQKEYRIRGGDLEDYLVENGISKEEANKLAGDVDFFETEGKFARNLTKTIKEDLARYKNEKAANIRLAEEQTRKEWIAEQNETFTEVAKNTDESLDKILDVVYKGRDKASGKAGVLIDYDNLSQEQIKQLNNYVKSFEGQIPAVKKRLEELTKKLSAAKDEAEKQKIKVQIENANNVLSELNSILAVLRSLSDGNFQAKIDIIENYRNGNAQVGDTPITQNDYYGGFGKWAKKDKKQNKQPSYPSKFIYPNADAEQKAETEQRVLTTAHKKQTQKIDDEEKKEQTQRERQEAQRRADNARRLRDFDKKQREEEERIKRENERAAEQLEIDRLQEGSKKTLRQIELNYQKELDAIEDWEKRVKEQKVSDAEQRFKLKNPDGIFDERKVNTSLTADEVRQKQIKEQEAAQKRNNEIDKALTSLKTPAEQYDEQKRKIEENIKALEDEVKVLEHAENVDEERLAALKERIAYQKKFNALANEARNARIDFEMNYGTAEQKKNAINEKYQVQIEQGTDPNKIASMMMQRNNELQKLAMEEIKSDFDWENVFSSLDAFSEDYLAKLKVGLKEALDTSDITAENAKLITDKINEIDRLIQQKKSVWGKLFSGSGSPLAGSWMGEANKQYNQQKAWEEKARADQENAERLQGKYIGKKADYDVSKSLFSEKLGLRKDASDEQIAEKAKKENLQTELAAIKEKGAQANAAKQASEEAGKQASQSAAKAQGGSGASAFAITDAIIHGVNQNVQSMSTMVQEWNIGSESFQESMAQFAESSQYATAAFDSLKNGDIAGVVFNLGEAVSSLGEAFGFWSNSNRAEIEKENNRLANAMEVNSEALDRLTKKITEGGSVIDKVSKANEAKTLLSTNQEMALQTMLNNASMYDGGHSLNHDFYEDHYKGSDLQKKFVARFGEYYGKGLSEILRLSPDQLNSLYQSPEGRQMLTELTQMIKESQDDGNYNGLADDLIDYINTYNSDAYNAIDKQLKEGILGVSLDGFRDEFKSTLMDMEADANTFSKNFTEKLTQSIVNARIDELFKGETEALYNKWMNVFEDGDVSKGEVENLKNLQEALSKKMIAERDKIFAMTGYDDIVSTKESGGTVNAAKSMSEDTANELVGRLTAIQLVCERIVAYMTATSSSGKDVSTAMSVIGGTLAQIATMGNGILSAEVMHTAQLTSVIASTSQTAEGVARMETLVEQLSEAIVLAGQTTEAATAEAEQGTATDAIGDIFATESNMLANLETMMNATMAQIGVAMAAQSNTLEDIQTILANSYLELRGINENTQSVVKPIQEMAQNMSAMRQKIDIL